MEVDSIILLFVSAIVSSTTSARVYFLAVVTMRESSLAVNKGPDSSLSDLYCEPTLPINSTRVASCSRVHDEIRKHKAFCGSLFIHKLLSILQAIKGWVLLDILDLEI